MRINRNNTGLTFGAFMALFHACWSLLILFGWAQGFIDWIFGLHMIEPPYTIAPFSWGNALLLIIVTGILGYIMGWVFAWIWNKLHRGA